MTSGRPRLRSIALAALLLAGIMNPAHTQTPGHTQRPPEPRIDIRAEWNFSDPAASEQRFLALAQQHADDEVLRAELMTQVARTHSLRRDFDRAHAILDAVQNGPGMGHPRVQVRLLLERGRSHNSSGAPDTAAPLFTRAAEIALQAGEDFLAGDAMHMAAILADVSQEADWIDMLRAHLAETPDSPARYWLGPMHNNYGWSLFEAQRLDEALNQFERSGAAYAESADTRMRVLIAEYAKGRVLRAMDRCAEAFPIQRAAFDAMSREFEVTDEYMAEEIALCSAALGDEETARDFAALAVERFATQDWFVTGEAERLETLRTLAGAP